VTDTIAHRRLIGVLVPAFNTVVEPELADLRPTGVSNQTARFVLDADVLHNVERAAAALATCRPNALVVGLATESFPGGLAVLRDAADGLASSTGLPVFTASHACHAALRYLGATRIAVVTPFDDAANVHVRTAFEESGFDVVSIVGLACPAIDTIGRTPSDDVRRAFVSADRIEADALVQVGTGLPVLHLIAALERDLAKPVVACNAAVYWETLRSLGIDDPIAGFGRLLR